MLRLQQRSLEWALAHAMSLGDTDILPPAFEFQAIHHDAAALIPWLQRQDIHTWIVRPLRTLLAPKAIYGFRVVTQLDPLDFLVLAATTYEMGSGIEARRIPPDQQVVFSNRFHPESSGRLFNPAYGYRAFVQETERLLGGNLQFSHVAIADIADFYHRIYHHRLENALSTATHQPDHVLAIKRLLSGWNTTETFGIPVGSAPSRLLAEITISDVDEALLAAGIVFVRYNDDYRLFSRSYAEAYRHLAFLADVLFRNHGLNLQPQKTSVLPTPLFRTRYLPTPEARELQSLQESFGNLVDELGLSDPYGEIAYDDLTEQQRLRIDAMNLSQLFRDQLQVPDPDLLLVRFILRRLAQLRDASVISEVLSNIDRLHPAFPDIVRYLASFTNLPEPESRQIGTTLLDLLSDSLLSELPYHRLWALYLFVPSTQWDNQERLYRMLSGAREDFTRRKIILAMGRAAMRHWFQSQWRSLYDYPPWSRRALLAAASCLAPDARDHLYRSLQPELDPLERAVTQWAQANPFA